MPLCYRYTVRLYLTGPKRPNPAPQEESRRFRQTGSPMSNRSRVIAPLFLLRAQCKHFFPYQLVNNAPWPLYACHCRQTFKVIGRLRRYPDRQLSLMLSFHRLPLQSFIFRIMGGYSSTSPPIREMASFVNMRRFSTSVIESLKPLKCAAVVTKYRISGLNCARNCKHFKTFSPISCSTR